MRDEQYYQISGWMINRLKLKGNELLVYAIIYGFTQDGESRYSGSIKYMCDFTGASKPTVIKSLKDLTERGLLQKFEIEKNGVRLCEYAARLDAIQREMPQAERRAAPVTGFDTEMQQIINYLNAKAGASYRHGTPTTRRLLIAILKSGYTVEDCKKVIDKKCAEWGGTDFAQYLRPQTLFGVKFEQYLNAPSAVSRARSGVASYQQSESITPEMMEAVWGGTV